MTLKELPIGKTATVRTVGGEGALRQHFLDMGIIPGAEVTMVKYAPMGDPVEVRIHSYELTLRLADAGRIAIDEMRDAVKEKEREDYPNLREFLRSVVVPEMQIKLRQGFGRAIRTETDTCAVAMLDPRAARGRRYFQSMVEALPEMPVTGSLRAVEQFYRDRKGAGYFRLPNAG